MTIFTKFHEDQTRNMDLLLMTNFWMCLGFFNQTSKNSYGWIWLRSWQEETFEFQLFSVLYWLPHVENSQGQKSTGISACLKVFGWAFRDITSYFIFAYLGHRSKNWKIQYIWKWKLGSLILHMAQGRRKVKMFGRTSTNIPLEH